MSMSGVTMGRDQRVRRGRVSTRHQRSIIVVLLLALLFYLWTAASTYPFAFLRVDSPYSQNAYNLLTTAFLHGHLYLPLRVPAGLLALHHPYDPTANVAYRAQLQDLLLYHHHLYSSWGPSSALLFLIVRVTGERLPTSLAVVVYCFVGLAAAVGLLHALARRFVPEMPDWMLTIATIGLALTNVAPFLLRRPTEYEVAISGAYAFVTLGLYLLVTASMGDGTRRRRTAVGSLLLGLAVLARPDMLAGGFVLIAVVIILRRRGERLGPTIAVAFTPFVVCVGLLVAYNAARFGGPSDFGTQYQLSGIAQLHKPTDQTSYIPPGLFSYLFIPASLSLGFPHVILQTTAQYPFSLPAGYVGTPGVNAPEITGGILPTMPITILLLGLPVMWRRRRPGEGDALLVIGALTGLALLVMVLLAYALWGTTQRYEMDFASLALIAAFLDWGVLVSRAVPRTRGRRGWIAIGLLLTTLGAGVGLALSFTGYSNLLQQEHPTTFNHLEDITSPVVTLVTAITGQPALVRVSTPVGVDAPAGSPYTRFDASGSTTALGSDLDTIVIASPGVRRSALTLIATPGAAPSVRGQTIAVTSSSGATTTVPILGSSVRIPLALHRGLNRFLLQAAGAAPGELDQIGITDLRLGG